jgi:hypothetical protein
MVLGKKLNARKIESWLERSLVPVEPSPAFVSELRGRLVVLRGSRMPSPWMVVLALSALLIIIVTWFGLGLRLVLALLGLIGLVERRRRSTEG